MARVFVLHPGAGSDLRTTENHSCGGSGVHTCHLRPGGCGSKRVGVKGRSQLCNKFKASQSHLEVLSFKERKKEKRPTGCSRHTAFGRRGRRMVRAGCQLVWAT